MWCLETINQLNQEADKLAKKGQPVKWAFEVCGIDNFNKLRPLSNLFIFEEGKKPSSSDK